MQLAHLFAKLPGSRYSLWDKLPFATVYPLKSSRISLKLAGLISTLHPSKRN